jgi:hypothetical protein
MVSIAFVSLLAKEMPGLCAAPLSVFPFAFQKAMNRLWLPPVMQEAVSLVGM